MKNFIILAHARSGSNSISNLIDSFPSTNVLIEPFNENFHIWNKKNPNYKERLDHGEELNLILNEIFRRYTGIKILSYQLSRAQTLEIIKDTKLKIIFLERIDKSAAVRSGLIAEQTGIWKKRDNKGQFVNTNKLEFDQEKYKKYLEFLEERTNIIRKYLHKYRGNNYLNLKYEEIFSEHSNKNQQTARQIADFLKATLPPPQIIDKFLKPSRSKIKYIDKR